MDRDWRSDERGLRSWKTTNKRMDRLLFRKRCGRIWEDSKRSASSRQPEGLQDSSRWSKRSADHRIGQVKRCTLKGCYEISQSCTHSGCELFFSNPFRWSTLRFDHRLLSRSPSG